MKTRPPWAERLRLSRRERRVLTELLRAGRTGLWRAMRARAVLCAAAGAAVSEIAREVGRDRKWVRHWLARFARDRLAGLQDAPRSGRPPKFSPRRAA
jgi:hypothetical protein